MSVTLPAWIPSLLASPKLQTLATAFVRSSGRATEPSCGNPSTASTPLRRSLSKHALWFLRSCFDQSFSSYFVLQLLHGSASRQSCHCKRQLGTFHILYLCFLSNLRLPKICKHPSHWCFSYLPDPSLRSVHFAHTRSRLCSR